MKKETVHTYIVFSCLFLFFLATYMFLKYKYENIVLLGDSTMAGIYISPIIAEQTHSRVKNMAIVGLTAKKLEDMVDSHEISPKHSTVCILIGINDIISGKKPFDVYDDIQVTVKKLKWRNENKVYVVIPLPCGKYKLMDSDKIEERYSLERKLKNSFINDDAENLIQLSMINQNMTNSQTLSREYDSGDGLHLNEFGQEMLAMAISQKIIQNRRIFK